MSDYFEADVFFGGVYQGRQKFSYNSIVGKLLQSDFVDAVMKANKMNQELKQLGCAKNPPNQPVEPTGIASQTNEAQ